MSRTKIRTKSLPISPAHLEMRDLLDEERALRLASDILTDRLVRDAKSISTRKSNLWDDIAASVGLKDRHAQELQLNCLTGEAHDRQTDAGQAMSAAPKYRHAEPWESFVIRYVPDVGGSLILWRPKVPA